MPSAFGPNYAPSSNERGNIIISNRSKSDLSIRYQVLYTHMHLLKCLKTEILKHNIKADLVISEEIYISIQSDFPAHEWCLRFIFEHQCLASNPGNEI